MLRTLIAFSLSSLFALSAQAADAPQVSGEAAWPEAKAATDLRMKAAHFPADAVAVAQFPALDRARVERLRRDNATRSLKALQIGIERDARQEGLVQAGKLAWRAQPDGSHVAQLRATSPGAAAMRVGLDVAQLPDGAELRYFGSVAPNVSEGVGTGTQVAALRRDAPVFWTPVTEGDTQLVEIVLPAGADPRWAQVSLAAVSHLLVSPRGAFDHTKIGESDSCEFDAKCLTNPDTAYNNAKNSVARMVFQSGGGSFLCTGTLLNDTDNNTQTPYFFGAAHCFTSQSVANTLTTFWFYEATACGSNVLDSAQRQVTGGATVLFSSVASDVLFMRLNSAPPGGSYFLGWNSATLAAGNNILVLHHPAGDVKKVSLGQVKGFGTSNLASGNFIKVGYTDGTTEGGSSGCALLTRGSSDYQLRGGLLGGSASCANTGSIATAANSDDFSRFDEIFPSLQSFLAPTTTQPPSNIDYSGAWSNSGQSGWGLNVIRGASGTYGMYIYHYDDANTPAWYLSFGNLSGTAYNAPVLTFGGPWFGNVPFNPALVTNRTSGTLAVNFTSATTATIQFTIDGRTVSTTLTKLAF
jgi:lysyl endopeptidase